MPKWRARKDSRGVGIVRGPVSDMNRRRRGESVRQAATSSNIAADAHVHAARDWAVE